MVDIANSAATRRWVVLLLVTLACFVALSLRLAFVNNSPGTPDSAVTLHIARNLLEGAGLKTHVVCQHFKRLDIPHAPTHRKPGLPLIAAGLFKLFGVSLKLPVLLNMVTVVATVFDGFSDALQRVDWRLTIQKDEAGVSQ